MAPLFSDNPVTSAEAQLTGRGKEAVEKPMFLKDYERRQLRERGVMAGVSDSEEDEPKVWVYD